MTEQLELNDDLYKLITGMSKKGDELFDDDYIEQAIEKYKEALQLLPEPIFSWEAATWLFTAIGDAYWALADYENAYEFFENALRSPGGIGNPFIHLRVGQLDYELGNIKKSEDELIRAYMGAGKDIFDSEHPKYFQVIKNIV